MNSPMTNPTQSKIKEKIEKSLMDFSSVRENSNLI